MWIQALFSPLAPLVDIWCGRISAVHWENSSKEEERNEKISYFFEKVTCILFGFMVYLFQMLLLDM